MNYNLNSLRQTYCRSATVTCKTTHELFPLEKGCEQGKILHGKRPKGTLDLKEFDPCGLQQTYRDETTGAELPIFAIFNLEGDHRCVFEIAVDSIPTTSDRSSLQAHMPFKATQRFVRKMNERNIMMEHLSILACGTLGSIGAVSYLVLETTGKVPGISLFGVLEGTAIGFLFIHALVVTVLEVFMPRKKLVIAAVFDGILPREAREKARAAKDQFDNLYLIVDQQGRWEGQLLPDPAPGGLDPLLVGELKGSGGRKYFVIDQFDLTAAEQYLIDEFALKNGAELP